MTSSVKMVARVLKTLMADLTAPVPVDLSDLTVRKVIKGAEVCDIDWCMQIQKDDREASTDRKLLL